MGALAAVASKDCSGGKANKTQQVTPLVATEEFICVSLYYLHLHFTWNHKFSATIPNLIIKSMCILTRIGSPKQTAL